MLIHGGKTWDGQGWGLQDIRVEKGSITTVGNKLPALTGDELIDATGLYVTPGFWDFHVHAGDRIGNYQLADDLPAATRLGVTNGITTLFTFVTQKAGQTAEEAWQTTEKDTGRLGCNVGRHITCRSTADFDQWYNDHRTAGRVRTVKLYTTYKNAGLYTSYDILEEYFRHYSQETVLFLLHAEDDEILSVAAARVKDNGQAICHAMARPAAAEVEAVRRIIVLARRYDTAVHIVHVSTPEALELIQQARGKIRISCETAPHYLFANQELLDRPNGHRYICSPPLRTAKEQTELARLVKDGWTDILATDHCPFTVGDKDLEQEDYRQVPNGLPGLGALTHMAFRLFGPNTETALAALCKHLAQNPARLTGWWPRKGSLVPGSDADICLINPHGPDKPVRGTLADCADPYDGVASTLEFVRVLVGGKTVVENGVYNGVTPGEWL